MKYQSDGGPGVADIARLFRSLSAPDRRASATRFFDALVFNVAIGATDAHAKNYSLLLAAGSRAQLGPMYDVATVIPYDQNPGHRAAMKIGSTWELRQVSGKDWAMVARSLGLPAEASLERVAALKAVIPESFDRAAHEDVVPPSLRDQAVQIADLVAAHVENRRGAFGVLRP
jgi:serine/threonine-protein kinase HipA